MWGGSVYFQWHLYKEAEYFATDWLRSNNAHTLDFSKEENQLSDYLISLMRSFRSTRACFTRGLFSLGCSEQRGRNRTDA